LPTNLTEIGREYFNRAQSVLLFNGSGNITTSVGVKMMSLREYAQSTFNDFATAYDKAQVPPPHFRFNPPQKGNLTLACLDQIENATHINFGNNTKEEIVIMFDQAHTVNLKTIDIQLARRSSCWFTSTHPLTCAEPKESQIQIQLQDANRFISETNILLKSRYNLEFTRCNAMDMPPEKIGFLPVMFETVRLSVPDGIQVTAIKIIDQNSGTLILSSIMGSVQLSSIS